MEAGPALDRIVLEKVFDGSVAFRDHEPNPAYCAWLGGCDGFGPRGSECSTCTGLIEPDCPQFSRDAAASMRVVDEMVAKGWDADLLCSHTSPEPILTPEVVWTVRFTARRIYGRLNGTKVFRANPDRRVAIALAAIRAVEASS